MRFTKLCGRHERVFGGWVGSSFYCFVEATDDDDDGRVRLSERRCLPACLLALLVLFRGLALAAVTVVVACS